MMTAIRRNFFTGLCAAVALGISVLATPAQAQSGNPVPLIFDTDIGNDVDDALALGMIHSLETRGECKLLAVTTTKDHVLVAPFVDAINTFYGRGDIPIGVCSSKKTPEPGTFNVLADKKDGDAYRFPHDLTSGKDAPSAVSVLRKALAGSADGSVVIAQVGFSTNLVNLLDSPADDISPLSGTDLVKKKVRLISIMAGAFEKIRNEKGDLYDHREYNVVEDLPAAQKLAANWPTPIVWSGFEIGLSLAYPHQSILQDYNYVKHHPLKEAYILYIPPPHDRPTWDLTSVLYAVRPERGYFGLSQPGQVTVNKEGLTQFKAEENGKHRYLTATPEQRARTLEALVQLSSQPPAGVK